MSLNQRISSESDRRMILAAIAFGLLSVSRLAIAQPEQTLTEIADSVQQARGQGWLDERDRALNMDDVDRSAVKLILESRTDLESMVTSRILDYLASNRQHVEQIGSLIDTEQDPERLKSRTASGRQVYGEFLYQFSELHEGEDALWAELVLKRTDLPLDLRLVGMTFFEDEQFATDVILCFVEAEPHSAVGTSVNGPLMRLVKRYESNGDSRILQALVQGYRDLIRADPRNTQAAEDYLRFLSLCTSQESYDLMTALRMNEGERFRTAGREPWLDDNAGVLFSELLGEQRALEGLETLAEQLGPAGPSSEVIETKRIEVEALQRRYLERSLWETIERCHQRLGDARSASR